MTHTSTEQPELLRKLICEAVLHGISSGTSHSITPKKIEFRPHGEDGRNALACLTDAVVDSIFEKVEAELCRLHSRVQELEAQLEAVGAGGVQALRKTVASSACSGCCSCKKQCQSKAEQAQAATVVAAARKGAQPVAFRLTNTSFRKPRYEYFSSEEAAKQRQADFNRSVDDGGLYDLTPLYTHPDTQGLDAQIPIPWISVYQRLPAWTDDHSIRVLALTAYDDFSGVQVHDIKASDFYQYDEERGMGTEVTNVCTHWVYRDAVLPGVAATHPTTQGLDAQAIERAAQKLAEIAEYNWAQLTEKQREEFRTDALSALTAALGLGHE